MRDKIKISTSLKDLAEQEVKQEKIENRKLNISIAISICILAGTLAYTKINGQIRKDRINPENARFFTKSIFKVPAILPIKNGTVNINIKNVFSLNELEQIKKGINELDDIAKNIDYEISFSDKTINKAINIQLFDEKDFKEQSENNIAFAKYRINQFSAEILYPITIKFNENYLDSDLNVDSIIKHELLHTLGFADLYDNKDRKRIMYYADLGNEVSENEIDILNTVYSPKYTGINNVVETILPTAIINDKIEEQEELQF